jgi:hypothetical protein
MNVNGENKTYRTLLAERQGRGFSEDEVTAILQQVLSQLAQDETSVHGSISLDTLVQDSQSQQAILLRSPAAIPDVYMAPERQKTGEVTPASDIYALGVTMVVLLTGKSPELLRNPNGSWNWEDYCLVNDRLLEVLNRSLAANPKQRYANAREMQQALNPTADFTPLPPTIIETPAENAPIRDRHIPISAASPPVKSSVKTEVSTVTQPKLEAWQWIAIGATVLGICILAAFGLNSSRTANTVNSTSSIKSSPSSPPSLPNYPTESLAISPPPQPINPFKNAVYPQSSCGDILPTDPNAYPLSFYPVFLQKSDRNLQKVTTQFCRDAYPMFRESKNQDAIQVASFSTRERAEFFREFLQENVGFAEVGEATIIDEIPEALRER